MEEISDTTESGQVNLNQAFNIPALVDSGMLDTSPGLSSSPSHSPSSSPVPPANVPPDSPPPQDQWFPFMSKPHMQLCLLYHGSHRWVGLKKHSFTVIIILIS